MIPILHIISFYSGFIVCLNTSFSLLELFDQQTTTHFDVDTTIPFSPQAISCLLLCSFLLVYKNNYYSFHTKVVRVKSNKNK